MEFSVGELHWFGRVLVEMRERAVALSHVETENGKSDGTNHLLLERTLLLVSHLEGTCNMGWS